MKKVLLALGVALLLHWGGFFRAAQAVDCSLTFEQGTRTLRACAGGFATPDELRNTTTKFTCLANSNAGGTITASACRGEPWGIADVTFTSNFVNSDIQSNTSGYWGCTGVGGLARAMGQMEVAFTNPAGQEICSKQQAITAPADWGQQPGDGMGIPFSGDTPSNANVCRFANNNAACIDCMNNRKGAWTAIGCIPTDPTAFISMVLGFGVGIAGGIAFLLILLGGFQILTSTGNPEQLQAGRELISSAISGLLLIIFSVFLLRLIGVDILGIPGFG